MNGPQAVVFDFDGTIVDSEMPIYRTSAAVLAEMGLTLTVPGWATVVGHGHDDSYRAMCEAVGAVFDRDAFEAACDAADASWQETLPTLPGVEALIRELHGAGVPLGVASSSSERWVDGHLRRLGLRDCFSVLASRTQVDERTKPDPASYRFAVEQLGVDPGRSIAVEDSAPGIAAALGAGLVTVAVPSEITRHTDLSAAHHQVASVADLSLAALAALL